MVAVSAEPAVVPGYAYKTSLTCDTKPAEGRNDVGEDAGGKYV